MSELWERVRADQLKVGDVFKPGVNFPPTKVERIEEGGWIKTEIYPVASNDPVLRRVDPSDDPRVLRRALEIACTDKDDDLFHEYCIDQARRELEAEATQ